MKMLLNSVMPVLFFTLILQFTPALTSYGRHNLFLGERTFSEGFFYSKEYTNNNLQYWSYVSEDLKLSFEKLPNAVITHIGIIDLIGNGQGGYATITSGGLGKNYVNINLRSKFGGSYMFSVQIFGSY